MFSLVELFIKIEKKILPQLSVSSICTWWQKSNCI